MKKYLGVTTSCFLEKPFLKRENLWLGYQLFVIRFNFRGDMQEQQISLLSGGERNRVHLAKMIKEAPNFIMLDEPTNDLDLEVLSNLETALASFNGAALVVSHDRFFLNKICTHILAFEGNGKVRYFEGNYENYINYLRQQGLPIVNHSLSTPTYYRKVCAAFEKM